MSNYKEDNGNPFDADSIFNYRRAMRKMDEQNLDAIVGATFTNVYYMSGVRTLFNEWYNSEPWEAAIVPRDPGRSPTFVTLTAVLPALVGGASTWLPNIALYDWLSIDKTPEPVDEGSKLGAAIGQLLNDRLIGKVENDIIAATVGALRHLGLTKGRIGFDDLRLAAFVKAVLPDIEVVDAHKLLLDIRKVRTPREIQLCSYAARINQLALDTVIREMREGVNWRDLAYLYKETWARYGGRALSDKGLLWGGKCGSEYIADTFFMPNNDFTLEAGKYYVLEGEGQVLQYNADASRTVFIGDPPKDYLRGVDAVMHAYEAMETRLIPGRSSKEVYKIGIATMDADGVPHPRKTLIVTHGVGLEFVEWYTDLPTQRAIPDSFEMEEGQTIGMDCLYYGHTLGTFHFENGMLLTKDGPRSFYAPPNSTETFYRGLVIKDGDRLDTYCPKITLNQEQGIPPEFVFDGSPVPSWCKSDVNGAAMPASALAHTRPHRDAIGQRAL